MKIIIFCSAILLLTSCHLNKGGDSSSYTVVNMSAFDDDFVVPSLLWKTFENDFPELTEIAAPKGGEKEEKGKKEPKKVAKKGETTEEDELLKQRPTLDPLSFSVFLTEKTTGVLGENYEMDYGAGGGTLDLKNNLPENRNGTFYLKLKYRGEMDPKKTKVYYLSNAKEREKGLGSGCNKVFDVTKFWTQAMKQEGLILNTVDFRHISLLSGTFFFVAPAAGKLRLGHLTVTDSRHKDLLCKAETKN